MSNVYAVDQGLGLQNETVDAVHYDDDASLLLIIKVGAGGGDTRFRMLLDARD